MYVHSTLSGLMGLINTTEDLELQPKASQIFEPSSFWNQWTSAGNKLANIPQLLLEK